MSKLFVFTGALAFSAIAGLGCTGGAGTAPTTPLTTGTAADVPAPYLAQLDAVRPAGQNYLEIIDSETGAVVLHQTLGEGRNGQYDVDIRSGQDLQEDPVSNSVFRVGLVLDTDGPTGMVPRYYSPGGNPIYYLGDTVCYDSSVSMLQNENTRMMATLGSFDVIFRHYFADTMSLIPSCVVGQNPLTISDVDFNALTPSGGPFTFSLGGDTFSATDMHFQLCNLPGTQFGTDLINTQIEWVVSGSVLGLPCQLCEIHCVVFNDTVGIYDPS